MQISKKVKINNSIYYIIVDVEYKKHDEGFPVLCLKNYKDDYWGGGDCSILIEEIEKSYSKEKINQYNNGIGFMADVLYIYDRISFISGIKDVYIFSKDNLLYSDGYISKDEIDKYIKDFNIKMNDNSNFKLIDARTWKL